MRQFDLDKTGLSFTRNWFLNRNLPTFRERVMPKFAGMPTIYLELGVFEGMSMCWMIQRVLTHDDSWAVGVDPWLQTTKLDARTMEDVHNRAVHNVLTCNVNSYKIGDATKQTRCTLVRGNSAEVLRTMAGKGYCGIKKRTVDVSMVDGNHNALAVLDDARLVYKLLKVGGWMLFDDYCNDIPKVDHVKEGVDMWMKEIGEGMKLVWKHRYMVCFEKVA